MIEIENPLENAYRTSGPVLLLAGPGTGKTHQLARRIKFLVEHEQMKAQPNEIAVITFTKESARNMRGKLSEENDEVRIEREKYPEIIGTMHSLGNMIIGSNPKRFGLRKKYEVLTEDAPREVFLKDATTLAGFEREKWGSVDECRRRGVCEKNEDEVKCKICKEYCQILRKCSFVDWDDQILLACQALRSDEELRREWKRRTRHLLVDEYQDINQAQCELIKLLTEGQTDGLFAVGDDDQSIYSFRGGTPKYIREFESDFGSESKIGRLSKSFRCPEYILKGARAMLGSFYKGEYKPEPTFDERIKVNNKISFYDVPSVKFEALKIAEIAKTKSKAEKVIIIVPNRNYLPPIKKTLKVAGLEYRCKGKLREEGLARFIALGDWVEDPENSYKLRYLVDLIINNHDWLTMRLEGGGDGITRKREDASELIAKLWSEVKRGNSLYKVLCVKTEGNNESSFLVRLRDTLKQVLELMTEKGNSRHGIVSFLRRSGLLVAPGKTPNKVIMEIREWKNEIVGSSAASSYEPINIYSIQSSKGLEGDVIFVVGLSEKIFPDPDGDIEEQSRLFFVAMTRAKKELHLFSTRTRPGKITYKKESYQLKKSPFIDAIPKEYIETNTIYKGRRG
jgi:DNA helicase-2/ATP-dependent DNA helicase PcrA